MVFLAILFSILYGAIDCDVKPKEAEVYIDGKFVGVAGEFDGWPRYLYIKPGKYEIKFKLEGYEDLTFNVEVAPKKIIRIKEKMKRVAPSQYLEEETEKRGIGKILISVIPKEAVLYLDGKFWVSGEEIERLHSPLQIPEGRHIINVLCPNHEEYKKEIEIKNGEFLELKVVLIKKGSSIEN